VEKEPLVAQGELGAGLRFGRVGVEYLATLRGRDYATQAEPHSWGSIGLVLYPRRR